MSSSEEQENCKHLNVKHFIVAETRTSEDGMGRSYETYCVDCSLKLSAKHRICKCTKQPLASCSSCAGTGKVKGIAQTKCPCTNRAVADPSCSKCFGSSLYTGSEMRWAKLVPFNVGSSKQMLNYAKFRGYRIPMNSKRKIAMDSETIAKLAKSTGDPLYVHTQKHRVIAKIKSSYADSWLEKLQNPSLETSSNEGRELQLAEAEKEWHAKIKESGLATIHTSFQFRPATKQLSSNKPNIQVKPSTKHGGFRAELATKFGEAVEAPDGHTLVECCIPGTKVLMHDLTWQNVETLKKGSKLWGFDETPVSVEGSKRPARYLRSAIVTNRPFIKKKTCYKVVTTQGTITVTHDHSFACRQSSYGKNGWVYASDLRPGQKLSFFTKPWDSSESLRRSYLAGIFDGEGHVSKVSVAYSQNPGPLADYVDDLLLKEGFEVRLSRHSTNPTTVCLSHSVECAAHPAYAGIRFLGQIRPKRLLPKGIANLEGTATWGKNSTAATVLSVKCVGIKEVVVVETSTHTLITNGFFSHNCDYRSFHALTLGYMARDSSYIRLARLDAHSFLCANMLHLQGSQDCLALPDDELKEYLKYVKKNFEKERNSQAKPAILGYGFGMGARKLYDLNQDSFRDVEEAKYVIDMLNACFPKCAAYRNDAPELAHKQMYLISPHKCIRWFCDVKKWNSEKQRWNHGKDWEKSIAFCPANVAFCVIQSRMIDLFNNGMAARYNLINNIHDALLFCPKTKDLEQCAHDVKHLLELPDATVTDPEGKPLWCEVEVKSGKNWAAMSDLMKVT